MTTKEIFEKFEIQEAPTSTFVESRSNLLEKMHSIMMCMNHEDAYMEWIETVPDGATRMDFEDIASDDKFFEDVLDEFVRIFSYYKKFE